MKSYNLLASVLFGSLAAAAPMNHAHKQAHKRAMLTLTSTLVQTEITYTTVFAGDEPAQATSAAAPVVSSVQAAASSINTPAAAAASSVVPSVAVPTSSLPAVVPTTSSIVVPATSSLVAKAPSSTVAPAQPTTSTAAPAQPTTSAAAVQLPSSLPVQLPSSLPVQLPSSLPIQLPSSTAAAAEPTNSVAATTSGGQVYSGGSMTLNDFAGGLGSCGKPIADSDMTVALASDLYGSSTYDIATGNPTNRWCNQKVSITYKGKTTTATIMDKCAGCTNGGFDMTPSLWEAVTGTTVGDRLTGMTWTTL